MTNVTLESVTKELFLMNWRVLGNGKKQSYAQRLNARLRRKDPLLPDKLALVAMIRAKGSEFTNLFEENRQHILAVLTKVATTSRDYWWTATTEDKCPPFTIGFAPSTLVEMTGSPDDPYYPFSLPLRPPNLTGEQALAMVNRLIDEELVERGYESGAFTIQYRDNPARKTYEPMLVKKVQ